MCLVCTRKCSYSYFNGKSNKILVLRNLYLRQKLYKEKVIVYNLILANGNRHVINENLVLNSKFQSTMFQLV